MRRFGAPLGLALGLAFVLTASGVAVKAMADEVTLFAAASLTEVAEALAVDFEARSGHNVTVVTAASSTLARQIEKGAPADVFISANEKWAQYVTDARGYSEPLALFGNKLVVVSNLIFETQPELTQLTQLLGEGRLAIGDPDHVPAGQYAQKALEAAGIWDAVKDRLAPAGDVRSALAFVTQGAAQYGIVYATDARDVAPVALEIDQSLYPPIRYFAVASKVPHDAVQRLMAYFEGPEARAIIAGMGFVVLER